VRDHDEGEQESLGFIVHGNYALGYGRVLTHYFLFQGAVRDVEEPAIYCDCGAKEREGLQAVKVVVREWLLPGSQSQGQDQEEQGGERLIHHSNIARAYLDNLSQLSHEDLDEDDGNLPIHNDELPVVGLRVSVPIVYKAILGLDAPRVQFFPIFKD
jgi:hypothetical protein